MEKNDAALWYVLAFTGLNLINKRLGPIAKCFRTCFILSFVIALSFAILYFCLIKRNLYKESILYVLVPINSGLMWFVSYSKRKAISNVVLNVYRKGKYYIVSEKSSFWIVIVFIIIGLVLPCLSCIYNQILMNFKTFDLIFSTFGYQMQYGISQRVFIFWIQFSTFLLNLSFSFYLEFCICILFCRCSQVLSEYCQVLYQV